MRRIVCLLYVFLVMLCCSANYAANPEELLPAEKAFMLQVRLAQDQALEFYWEIAPGYFLYKDQIQVINSDNTSLINNQTLPTGIVHQDEVLGEYTVYADKLIFTIPWLDNFNDNSLIVRYQGCAQSGFCYAPEMRMIHVNKAHKIQIKATTMEEFPGAIKSEKHAEAKSNLPPTLKSASDSDSDKLAATIKNRFLPFTLGIFFVLGILLSFSPCVLPMIPLVVNLIVGPKPISSHKALVLASSYVLGMAGSYACAGMLVGMLGSTLQAWLQQPAILVSLSVVLVMLALSQFELVTIKLPHFNSKLHHWGQRQLQGSVGGAFVLGVISALIVSPCITAPLIGALTYIGHDGNPVIGALTLFSLGLGMGVPLIVVAMLSSIILPAVGHWMNLIKSGAGIALLGLAIWILERVIPSEYTQILWGGLCIITAALLKAFEPLKHAKRATTILKGIGVILAIYGAVLIADAVTSKYHRVTSQHWQNVNSSEDLRKSLAAAKIKQQPSIVEFYAQWCTSCKRIDAEVFANPTVQKELKRFNLLRVDISNMGPQDQELLQQLEVFGPPTILFFNRDGVEIKDQRVVGNVDVATMLKYLQ